jgi:pyruvate dehydrogenase (quinone)
MVTWEQRVMEGDPKFDDSQVLPDFPYAKYAESLGLMGIRVTDPDKLKNAWRELLHADKPSVLEVVVDPEVPPLPPHITREQAMNYARAILKGDPSRGNMIIQTFRQRF